MAGNISKRSLFGSSFCSGFSVLSFGFLATTYTGSGSIVNKLESKKGIATADQPILSSDIYSEL